MKVEFTKDAEEGRINPNKPTWEFLETTNLVQALHKARDMGWKENKVQVRYVKAGDITTYFVEPYEKGCGCRGILKYKEYFN